MQCDDCDREATGEHHVTYTMGEAPPERGDVVHHHCGPHHSACVAALNAVPIDHPSRYAMQWSQTFSDPKVPNRWASAT